VFFDNPVGVGFSQTRSTDGFVRDEVQVGKDRGRQKGGFSRGGASDLMENLSFWSSGRPRAAEKPFKKVGGKAPYLLKGFLGRPGPPRTPK